MATELKTNDPSKAKQFFADKLAFTTGPVELARNLKEGADLAVIDVREAEDYRKGHIPGAVNLPHDKWKKEDIDISMEGNTLCICGDRKEERDERSGAGARRSERFYGRFQRNLTLPHTVDVKKIEAKYKDGVLSITLPKSEEAKRKQIEIKAM
jgi:HSP20 family molecular chaperone IbpA